MARGIAANGPEQGKGWSISKVGVGGQHCIALHSGYHQGCYAGFAASAFAWFIFFLTFLEWRTRIVRLWKLPNTSIKADSTLEVFQWVMPAAWVQLARMSRAATINLLD